MMPVSFTAATRAATAQVSLVTDHSAFLELEPAWNDAVRRASIMHPFLRHEWVRTWWEAFGAGARLHVLVVNIDGRIAAIAPFMRETTMMYGIPARRLRLMQNDHTPRTGIIVAAHPEQSYRAIWNALHEDRGSWDVVLLGQIEHESPTYAAFSEFAAANRCSTGVWKSSDSPYVTLNGTWDEYSGRLSAKFRSNLRNRLSRLARHGDATLEVLTDGAAIQAASDDAWRLEASGWKQQAGTAIASDPAVERFYSTLIGRAASAGWLRLLFLNAGGRRIATSYSACFERRLLLFKTGYDPEYATCAPFKLLVYFAVRDACERGLAEVDFLGDSEPWKLEWTSTTRGHDWLYVFADTLRGRLLHSVKFKWGPELKQWWA